jgi:hypothetical protein
MCTPSSARKSRTARRSGCFAIAGIRCSGTRTRSCCRFCASAVCSKPGDPIERFKEAQREFIRVAGRFDLDPTAKVRADDLREEMKSAAQEIAKHPDRMREAKRAGIGGQVKRLVRQAERERGCKKGKGLDRDEGLER